MLKKSMVVFVFILTSALAEAADRSDLRIAASYPVFFSPYKSRSIFSIYVLLSRKIHYTTFR